MVYNDTGSFNAGSDLVAVTWLNMDPIIKVQSLTVWNSAPHVLLFFIFHFTKHWTCDWR